MFKRNIGSFEFEVLNIAHTRYFLFCVILTYKNTIVTNLLKRHYMWEKINI